MIGRIAIFASLVATQVYSQEHRELGAHEHGVGQMDIAIEGTRLWMELHAPGADIVGFEHAAGNADDRAKIDSAVALLARPLDLFVFPSAAECTVVEAKAEIEAETHEESGEEGGHDHDEADAHDDDGGHTEFHAEYALDCANPSAIDRIAFAYFETFPNARELELQVLTETGAQAFEIERNAPVLELAGRS
ncbi:DUF2796 domain-containing protein [Tropicimonas isoalkanivorans]|uniref:DUF2796 domain-containing protein n=1 Tax=Tropicimonas isoalkanivorans TaxID=441112 RepID=A0A1I1DRL3_9RHOB|nr:DUF2796 domain-containing protein [Tropicimonas isoalkanivorans]SFB77056.1 Protein of unknown function [Tropicimonas isoalkanivorans]